MDDTVDQFVSLMAGVAKHTAKQDYTTENFRLFHSSLLYVCDYEERIYNRLDENEQYGLDKVILKVVKQVEEEY